jgi:hypothetical protein
MEIVVVVALGMIVAIVTIDSLRTRPPDREAPKQDPTMTTSQQIIVDLSKRR